MKTFVLGLIFLLLCCTGVYAREITSDVIGGAASYADDIVVAENVIFMPNRMDVTKTILIENNGRFYTDVYVCDMCELYVQNRGDFSANVNLGNQSALYRVISGADDLGNINFGTDYSVLVRGANNLSLDDVMDSVVGAGRIIIQDSMLDLNDVGAGYTGYFELRGDVVFRMETLPNTYVGRVLDNVSGDAQITIERNDTDIMYADYAYISDSVLYIGRKRETDYVKILGDESGEFLNSLRDKNPNDSLLLVLDSAMDMNALYDVMSESVRFVPDKLLDAVRTVDAFGRGYDIDNSVGIAPFVIMSDNFYAYGVDVRAQIWANKNLNIGMGMRAGMMDYSSSFDEFSVLFYGISGVADYVFDNNLFVHGAFDMSVFDSDIESVFWNKQIVHDPSVIGINTDIDIGYKYAIGDSFYVAPFVGVDADLYCLDVMNKWFVPVHGGVTVGYSFETLGIRYEYDVSVSANSDNRVSAIGRIGFWSDCDAVGGDVSVSVLRMLDTTSYQISAGGKLWF